MQTRNFVLGGLLAGFINFLLGWLFYGIIFSSFFPNQNSMNLLFIALGCFSYGFFISYIFNKWTNITSVKTAIQTGAVLGFMNGLTGMFFIYAPMPNPAPITMFLEVVINIVSTAFMGAGIALIISRFSDKQ